MANLSDLDLVNEDGDTKSNYTLLKNHATALERVSEKAVFITGGAGAADVIIAVEGTSYFVDTTAGGSVTIALPESTTKIGMRVRAKLVAGTGALSIDLVEAVDTINGGTGAQELTTPGDYIDTIATEENGWWCNHLVIA